MSVLKLEIEKYLLENNFSLVKDVYSADTMFVYNSNLFDWFRVCINVKEKHNLVVCYFESIDKDEYKISHIKRIVLKSLDEFKFLATHCLGSPLFDKNLII